MQRASSHLCLRSVDGIHCLKGNIETHFDDPQFKSRNVELRRRLDLYANVLHCISIPTIPARHKGIDIVIVRCENLVI